MKRCQKPLGPMRLAVDCMIAVLLSSAPSAAADTTAEGYGAAYATSGYLKCVVNSNQPIGYYSPRLKAQLLLERVSIPGYTFWGARIVYLQPDSPLRALNLNAGDMITRLDGIRIDRNKYWIPLAGGGYWALPQIERHFGNTTIRHFHAGEHEVHDGTVRLGPSIWPQVNMGTHSLAP